MVNISYIIVRGIITEDSIELLLLAYVLYYYLYISIYVIFIYLYISIYFIID